MRSSSPMGRRRQLLILAATAVLLGARWVWAAPSLDDRIRQVDRNAAQRFLTLGTTAARAKHADVAVQAFGRVLDLDGENSTARRELGFRKGPQGWRQEKPPAVAESPASAEEAHMSLEVWTFVRFLAFLDPDAFRSLPAALAGQAEGPEADRADVALRSAYGRGLEDLGPLWHRYVLEVM